MIEVIKYLILGLVQGFTEPIPVSSSGHIQIFKVLLGNAFPNDLNFEIVTNFGSFIAIVIFFWKDIKELIHDFFLFIKTKEKKYKVNFKYCWLIVVGTIPAGIVGLLFKDQIESIDNIKIVGLSLVVTSFFLYLIKDFKGMKSKEDITFKDAFIVGLFQVVALFPGISRSGATIVGCMLLKMKREEAFKFSFMLYLPISVATMILGVKDLLETNITSNMMINYSVGFVAALILTFFSTKWFHSIVKKGKLAYFVWYCLIVGFLVLLFL